MDENIRLLTEIRDAIRANGEQNERHYKLSREMSDTHFRTLIAEYQATQAKSKKTFCVLAATLIVLGTGIGMILLGLVIDGNR